jgi:hypothetical protein
MDFTTIPAGCLTTGTATPLGTIEQVSVTAYRIAGTWVPFARIHGTRRAEALAIPQEIVNAVTPDMARTMRAQSDRNIARMLGGG